MYINIYKMSTFLEAEDIIQAKIEAVCFRWNKIGYAEKNPKYWKPQGKWIAFSFYLWQYKTQGNSVKLKTTYLQILEKFFP